MSPRIWGSIITTNPLNQKSVHFELDGGSAETATKMRVVNNLTGHKGCEGTKIWWRAKWFAEGKQCTRFFFLLEQRRAAKDSFQSLLDNNSMERKTEIESILVDFSLFSKDTVDMQM